MNIKLFSIGCFFLLLSFEFKANREVEKNIHFFPSKSSFISGFRLLQKNLLRFSPVLNRAIKSDNVLHEFHICKTDINYDTKSQTLQFTLQIYIDDLERALIMQGKKNINIGSTKENAHLDEWIIKYFIEKFNIKMNGQKLKPKYLGKELSEEKTALYCYFELPVPQDTMLFTMTNTILQEVFKDQKNVVNFTKNKKRITQFLFDDLKDVQILKL